MARGLTFSAGLTALIALALVHETLSANDHYCPPSSCGNISNISAPFRLKSDPEICGDSRYELSLIDMTAYTTFQPKITKLEPYEYRWKKSNTEYGNPELSRIVVFMNCEKPVNSPYYLDTSTCINNSSNYISRSKRYRYVKVGKTNANEMADSCRVEKMTRTSWPRNDDPDVSCKDVHNELVYGFEISWLGGNCESFCGRQYSHCNLNDTNHIQCYGKIIGG
ncbi:hypothetical protein SO802_008887 [Lithocarpus litseifolius]|uniref:Uncharacterized protein n=1 Tax=Lithocarpus litseifolius TaxID=425828 RepID=A0AAW2DDQ8_9ROSI